MAQRIPRFRRGQKMGTMLRQLNQIVDALNDLQVLRGDGLVEVKKVRGTGYAFSLNVNGVRPLIGRPPPVHGATVVEIYDEDGAVWQNYIADGFQSHVTANPCNLNGTNLNTDVTLYIKLMGTMISADEAHPEWPVGYMDVAANDIIGWTRGDRTEGVPGATDDTKLDGYVYPWAGSGYGAPIILPS